MYQLDSYNSIIRTEPWPSRRMPISRSDLWMRTWYATFLIFLYFIIPKLNSQIVASPAVAPTACELVLRSQNVEKKRVTVTWQ